MFSHVMVGSNDLEKSKAFYDATFCAVGGEAGSADPKGRVFYRYKDGLYGVGKPIDGQPATAANGGTIGFMVDSPEQVDAWHAAGVAHGGTAIEDPPGPRPMGEQSLYLAYLRDPDGHKLCALHWME